MALVTTFVRGYLYAPDGSPLANTPVTIRLTKQDRDMDIVVPEVVNAVTDANGLLALPLWPNTRGTAGSQYRVTVKTFGGAGERRVFDRLMTVPDTGTAALSAILDSDPPDTQSVSAAINAAASATSSAQIASQAADVATGASQDARIAFEAALGSETQAAFHAEQARRAAINAINAPGTLSTTQDTFDNSFGVKTFTTQVNKEFQLGQYVLLSAVMDPTIYAMGFIQAYSKATGLMSVNVNAYGTLSGPMAGWRISLTLLLPANITGPSLVLMGGLTADTVSAGAAAVSGNATVGGTLLVGTNSNPFNNRLMLSYAELVNGGGFPVFDNPNGAGNGKGSIVVRSRLEGFASSIYASGYDPATATAATAGTANWESGMTGGVTAYQFVYNGFERARITSGGNLLVGTAVDSGTKLSVSGNIGHFNATANGEIWNLGINGLTNLFAMNLNGSPGLLYQTVFNNSFGQLKVRSSFSNEYPTYSFIDDINTGVSNANGTPDTLSFVTNGNERARIDSAGNLQIGTTILQGRLALAGSGLLAQLSNNLDANFIIKESTALISIGTGVNAALAFTTSDAERARITSGGNLLVGTTVDRNAKLVIEKNIQNDPPVEYLIGDNLMGDIRFARRGTIDSFPNSYAQIRGLLGDNDARRTILTFSTSDAGDVTERARITSAGNLLVGTTGDTGYRQAVFAGNNANILQLDTTATNGGYAAFQTNGTVRGLVGPGANVVSGAAISDFGISASSQLLVGINGTERARLTSVGNQIDYQPAESPQNASATLTIAQLQSQIITSNAAVTLTLPTGTALEGYTTNMAVNTAFEVVFIATTANSITIADNGNTTVGSLTVNGNTSARFRFRKTATNTFTVYRV